MKYLGAIWYNREFWRIPYLHVEYVLSSGAVKITKADVDFIGPMGCTWYLYVLFARHVPELRRSWNPTLCDRAQEMIWRHIDSIGPVTVTYADLSLTIQEEYADEFMLCLRCFPVYARPEPTRDEWLSAACLILLLGPGEEILSSPRLESVLAGALPQSRGRTLPILESLLADGTLAKQLLEARAALYEKRIRAVNGDSFREELLATAWEPSRLAWCVDFEGDFKLCV